ncbi:MAG: DNA pilot protein [Microvirus sp.]|nr:MAG: DNA pilot protein [Microvirus sp.]
MSLLGTIGAIAGETGLDMLSGAGKAAIGAHYDRKLQEDSQNFSREQMQNAVQWKVNDLKSAGLNPILATQSGGAPMASVGSASRATVPAGPKIDIMDTMAKQAQIENIEADTRLKESQTGKTGEETTTISVMRDIEAGKTKADTALAGAKTDGERQKIINLKKDLEVKEKEIIKLTGEGKSAMATGTSAENNRRMREILNQTEQIVRIIGTVASTVKGTGISPNQSSITYK